MRNLLFEIIMSNQCNKRCDYCDLNFRNKNISFEVIDQFYKKYCHFSENTGVLRVNFFGGEPLLFFEGIEYFVEKFKNFRVQYSLGTNGDLLSDEKMKFFKQHHFQMYVSVDAKNISSQKLFSILDSYREMCFINAIFEPGKTAYMLENLHNLENFPRINMMPIYTTLDRGDEDLKGLLQVFLFFKKYFTTQKLQFFPYYKGETQEQQFILDTSGEVYQDIDSLLWLQKQYKLLPKDLKRLIEKKSFLGNISDLSFENILDTYDAKALENCILAIPKVTNNTLTNIKLQKMYHHVFG